MSAAPVRGTTKVSHSCPYPNYDITNPRPLGFMLPSMKSTLAFLSLRRTLLTCGQMGTPQHEQGTEWELPTSSKALSRTGPYHPSVGVGPIASHDSVVLRGRIHDSPSGSWL